MISSLYTALTGLSAFTRQMGIISNNVANVGTTGYKANSVNFAEMLARATSPVSGDAGGCGVTIQAVSENWTQGTITDASSETYLAINGYGMFVVKDALNDMPYYTRDGTFSFNKQGYLRTTSGLIVQGYPVDDNGNLGTIGDIRVSYENLAPVATTELSATLNLSTDAVDGDEFYTTVSIYDSLGNEIPVTITYTKTATANEWTWEASIPSEYGSISAGSTGTLVFDTNGELVSGTDPTFTLTLTNGAANQNITWDLYDTAGDTLGLVTQYSGESVMTDNDQDGSPPGEVTDIAINSSGQVVASYSNNEIKVLYVLALADFNNYDGLTKVDGNLYTATLDSGQAILGTPNNGRMGSIKPESLEMSNVDIASQMANLITAQTAYQACSKVFTASDEILQILMKM